MITVKFWNKNAWHEFETYGIKYEDEARRVAKMLAVLFSVVEMHFYFPLNKTPLEIEVVHA